MALGGVAAPARLPPQPSSSIALTCVLLVQERSNTSKSHLTRNPTFDRVICLVSFGLCRGMNIKICATFKVLATLFDSVTSLHLNVLWLAPQPPDTSEVAEFGNEMCFCVYEPMRIVVSMRPTIEEGQALVSWTLRLNQPTDIGLILTPSSQLHRYYEHLDASKHWCLFGEHIQLTPWEYVEKACPWHDVALFGVQCCAARIILLALESIQRSTILGRETTYNDLRAYAMPGRKASYSAVKYWKGSLCYDRYGRKLNLKAVFFSADESGVDGDDRSSLGSSGSRSPSPHARLEVASGDRYDLHRLAAKNHRRLTLPTREATRVDGDEMDLQKLQPSPVTGSRSELIHSREKLHSKKGRLPTVIRGEPSWGCRRPPHFAYLLQAHHPQPVRTDIAKAVCGRQVLTTEKPERQDKVLLLIGTPNHRIVGEDKYLVLPPDRQYFTMTCAILLVQCAQADSSYFPCPNICHAFVNRDEQILDSPSFPIISGQMQRSGRTQMRRLSQHLQGEDGFLITTPGPCLTDNLLIIVSAYRSRSTISVGKPKKLTSPSKDRSNDSHERHRLGWIDLALGQVFGSRHLNIKALQAEFVASLQTAKRSSIITRFLFDWDEKSMCPEITQQCKISEVLYALLLFGMCMRNSNAMSTRFLNQIPNWRAFIPDQIVANVCSMETFDRMAKAHLQSHCKISYPYLLVHTGAWVR
ncbi:hypothetical protein CCUS01_12617 [Colletotrichum cuscutae]|uniref:Uncharacterized protein n=1 Tax=Colletotrichum cuscutae TaxID=1209917 RepID=A0AAI9TTR2_9PEZI|nr:hypothetical protein CCUS01_12617 [Colletotrichum cuscutae]